MLSLVAAIGKNRELGFKNKLLWHLPDDFARFKEITTGHSIIMGRKTYESIGKPLPSRKNIIISRSKEFEAPGGVVVHSLKEAIEEVGRGEAFVIGGAEIYKMALPLANKIYLTCVNMETEADVFFPELGEGEWKEVSREKHVADERHAQAFDFKILERT
jgi:dihydrofolate reductase